MKEIPRAWWLAGIGFLCLACVAPLVATRFRDTVSEGSCTLDGTKIEPSIRVRIITDDEQSHLFCSLACAEWWLAAKGVGPVKIYVTDEVSGEELEASEAFYVRSQVVTRAHTRERRHVFGTLEDAKRHARVAPGRRLVGDDRPFATFLGSQ